MRCLPLSSAVVRDCCKDFSIFHAVHRKLHAAAVLGLCRETRQQWVRGEGSSVGRRNGGRGVLCNGNQPKPYAVANFGRTLGELAGTLGKVLLALGDVDGTKSVRAYFQPRREFGCCEGGFWGIGGTHRKVGLAKRQSPSKHVMAVQTVAVFRIAVPQQRKYHGRSRHSGLACTSGRRVRPHVTSQGCASRVCCLVFGCCGRHAADHVADT